MTTVRSRIAIGARQVEYDCFVKQYRAFVKDQKGGSWIKVRWTKRLCMDR